MSKGAKALPMYEFVFEKPFDTPLIWDRSQSATMVIPLVDLKGYAGISRKTIKRVYQAIKFLRRENRRLKEALMLQQQKEVAYGYSKKNSD